MKVNQIRAGAALSYVSMALSTIISLVYTPIMLDRLGDSEFGVYQAVLPIISYLNLLSFGLGSAYVRYYSRFRAAGDKKGIRRYGNFLLPMDEALVLVALDLSGRPWLGYEIASPAPRVLDIDVRLFHEFFQALCVKAGMNLHIRKLAGEEVHHVFEAVFKGFAKALDQAVGIDPRIAGVLSTKGSL